MKWTRTGNDTNTEEFRFYGIHCRDRTEKYKYQLVKLDLKNDRLHLMQFGNYAKNMKKKLCISCLDKKSLSTFILFHFLTWHCTLEKIFKNRFSQKTKSSPQFRDDFQCHRDTGTACTTSHESPTGTREADAVLCFVFSRDIKLELLVSPISLRRTQTEPPPLPHEDRIG